jgi:hypothetical protein
MPNTPLLTKLSWTGACLAVLKEITTLHKQWKSKKGAFHPGRCISQMRTRSMMKTLTTEKEEIQINNRHLEGTTTTLKEASKQWEGVTAQTEKYKLPSPRDSNMGVTNIHKTSIKCPYNPSLNQ